MDWVGRIARFQGIGTFTTRCVALLAFALVVSALDFARAGRRATRWREYALLFLAAAMGAACGALTDAVTSRVSPPYFEIAKGIVPGAGFHARAVALGAQAGAGYGALLGGVLMFAAGRGFASDPAAVRRVVRACFTIPAWALAAGAVALTVRAVSRISPAWFREWSWLTEEEVQRATAVWLGHLGLYAGALIGTIVVIRDLRRLKSRRLAMRDRMAGEAGIEPATY